MGCGNSSVEVKEKENLDINMEPKTENKVKVNEVGNSNVIVEQKEEVKENVEENANIEEKRNDEVKENSEVKESEEAKGNVKVEIVEEKESESGDEPLVQFHDPIKDVPGENVVDKPEEVEKSEEEQKWNDNSPFPCFTIKPTMYVKDEPNVVGKAPKNDDPASNDIEIFNKLKTIGEEEDENNFLVKSSKTLSEFAYKRIDISDKNDQDIELILKEAELIRKLKHPNVTNLYEATLSEDKKCLEILSEFTEDGDLQQKLDEYKKDNKHIPENLLLDWLNQMCFALDYIKSQNCVHRNIKPSSIFLMKLGFSKLGDFGLNKIISDNGVLRTVMPKEECAAPENIEKKEYTIKTDIWHLGVTFFELMTFQFPFKGENNEEKKNNILSDNRNDYNYDYSNDFKELINKMLSKDPNSRPMPCDILALPFIRKRIESYLDENDKKLIRAQDTLFGEVDEIETENEEEIEVNDKKENEIKNDEKKEDEIKNDENEKKNDEIDQKDNEIKNDDNGKKEDEIKNDETEKKEDAKIEECEKKEEIKNDETVKKEEKKVEECEKKEEIRNDENEKKEEAKVEECDKKEEAKNVENEKKEEAKEEAKVEECDKKEEAKIEECDKKEEAKIEECDKKEEAKNDESEKKEEAKVEECEKKEEAKIEETDKKEGAKIEETDKKEEIKNDEIKNESQIKNDEIEKQEEIKNDETEKQEEIKNDDNKNDNEIKNDENEKKDEIKENNEEDIKDELPREKKEKKVKFVFGGDVEEPKNKANIIQKKKAKKAAKDFVKQLLNMKKLIKK